MLEWDTHVWIMFELGIWRIWWWISHEYPMVCEETFHAININDLEIGQGPSIRLGQNWSSTLNGFKIWHHLTSQQHGKTLSKWRFLAGKIIYTYPICSMYGICINIYPKRHPNVGKYTMHGASGYGISKSIAMFDCRVSVFQIFEMAQQRTATSW